MTKPELSRLICARLNSKLDVMVLSMPCATQIGMSLHLKMTLPLFFYQKIANIPNVALNCNPTVPVDGQELKAFGWERTCESSDTAAPIPAPGEPTAAPTPTAFLECPKGLDPIKIEMGNLEYLTNQEYDSLVGDITDDMLCANTTSTRGVAVGSGDSGMCNSGA